MLLIPIGLIPVFFYFNMELGGRTVDLLPDAVGYLLILYNAWKLRGKSYSFSNLVYLSAVLAVYATVVRQILPTGMAGLAASLLELILQLYLLKLIVSGVEDLGRIEGRHMNGAVLNRWRLGVSIAWAAVFVCAAAGVLAPWLVTVGALVVAVWAVLCILFLVSLFRTAHRYKLLLQADADEAGEQEEDGGGA